jgi:hypothetical protein
MPLNVMKSALFEWMLERRDILGTEDMCGGLEEFVFTKA